MGIMRGARARVVLVLEGLQYIGEGRTGSVQRSKSKKNETMTGER